MPWFLRSLTIPELCSMFDTRFLRCKSSLYLAKTTDFSKRKMVSRCVENSMDEFAQVSRNNVKN